LELRFSELITFLNPVMLSHRLPTLAVLASLLLMAGCKDRAITAYRAPKDPAPSMPGPAAAQSMPGMPDNHPPVGGAQGALPDNHPPVGNQAGAPGSDMAKMANTAVPTAGGSNLSWSAPAAWTPKTGSSMRKGSYAVKGPAGEADFAITAFPGDTGGLHANLNRWRGQVGLPNAAPAELDAALLHFDGKGGLHFEVIDLVGPSGNPPIRMLGAITSYGGNSWFFKLMGPDGTVAAEKQAFLDFLNTVKTP
jgi:hypothetical protein